MFKGKESLPIYFSLNCLRFNEYFNKVKIGSLPRMLGFQAAGSAPIVHGKIIKDPKTIATAIKIGNPASWKKAEEARDDSGGPIDMVSDEEILKAYSLLARAEGIFVEPASAASVAGVLKLAGLGYFKNAGKANLVCVVTGHGLKDPDRAIKFVQEPEVISADIASVLEKTGIKK